MKNLSFKTIFASSQAVLFVYIFGIFCSLDTAAAQRRVGSGGLGVYCPAQNDLEMLDLVDGSILWGRQHIDAEDMSFDKYASLILSLAYQRNPARAASIAKKLESFFESSAFVENVELTRTNDQNNILIPSGYELVQIAIQRKPRFPGEKTFFISKKFRELLDVQNRFTLVLHELIYQELLSYGETDSYSTRYLTSLWLSEGFDVLSLASYNAILYAANAPLTKLEQITQPNGNRSFDIKPISKILLDWSITDYLATNKVVTAGQVDVLEARVEINTPETVLSLPISQDLNVFSFKRLCFQLSTSIASELAVEIGFSFAKKFGPRADYWTQPKDLRGVPQDQLFQQKLFFFSIVNQQVMRLTAEEYLIL